MAEILTPNLDAVELDLPDAQDPMQNPASNRNGLSGKQRFFVKNFFDTQLEKRKQYLKELGYEMGKDGETYRPVGSDADFIPIEEDNTTEGGAGQAALGGALVAPIGAALGGPLGAVAGAAAGGLLGGAGLLPYYNLSTLDGWKELGRDGLDMAFDTLVAAPAITVGSEIGMGAGVTSGGAVGAAGGGALAGPPGAAAGTAVGSAAGALGGSIAGGAAGNAAAEALKAAIGAVILDKSVPMDLREATYQSLTAGVLNGLQKNAGAVVKAWKGMKLDKAQAVLKEALIRKSGGMFNDDLATDFIKNPERYTPEAVKGARQDAKKFIQSIFGTSDENPYSTRQLKSGVARDAIDPLNKQTDLEIERLTLDKRANSTVEDLVKVIKDAAEPIQQDVWKGGRAGKEALKYFSDEIEDIKNVYRTSGPTIDEYGRAVPGSEAETFREIPFAEYYKKLKHMQKAVYDEKGPVKGNSYVKDATANFKNLAYAKAGELGSPLPEINAKRSEILDVHKNLNRALTPAMLESAFVGNDKTAKEVVKGVIQHADSVLDTDLYTGLQSAQFRSSVESFYRNPRAFGSGSVLGEAMSAGIDEARSGALKGGTAGGIVGGVPGAVAGGKIGFGLGAVKGFKQGALTASPDTIIKQASKIKTKLSDLNKDPTRVQKILNYYANPAAIAGSQLDAGTADRAAMMTPGPVNTLIDAGAGAVQRAVAPGPGPVAEPPADLATPNLDALELDLPPLDEEPKP